MVSNTIVNHTMAKETHCYSVSADNISDCKGMHHKPVNETLGPLKARQRAVGFVIM